MCQSCVSWFLLLRPELWSKHLLLLLLLTSLPVHSSSLSPADSNLWTHCAGLSAAPALPPSPLRLLRDKNMVLGFMSCSRWKDLTLWRPLFHFLASRSKGGHSFSNLLLVFIFLPRWRRSNKDFHLQSWASVMDEEGPEFHSDLL